MSIWLHNESISHNKQTQNTLLSRVQNLNWIFRLEGAFTGGAVDLPYAVGGGCEHQEEDEDQEEACDSWD